MQVALLQIKNFRGIRNGKVQFRNHTILIGPNNSGKTTIVEALALVLGRDRLVRSLTEHDFYGSDPEPASRIKIIATITGFEPDDLRAHTDWFREGRGVPVWFDPIDGSTAGENG
jgi:putative ATP-dependent endonuclease of the OLD family